MSQPRRPTDVAFHTRFFRNAPQFEVLRNVVRELPAHASLRVASVGCSSGAELYSALWVVRGTRPDLRVTATGLDIDAASLRKAQAGTFTRNDRELSNLSEEEIATLCDPSGVFVADGESLSVAPWVRAGCSWLLADVREPTLARALGPHDVVFANNILCHMHDAEAEACLRSITTLVAPRGHLFMFGVDLDVKSRVIPAAGLTPVPDQVAEAYLVDREALAKWPFTYWGREPLDTRRRDWLLRYAAVYRRPE